MGVECYWQMNHDQWMVDYVVVVGERVGGVSGVGVSATV